MSEDKPIRRRLPLRWLTLAEVVGIVAVTIAGLGYWDSHRGRAEEERLRRAEARAEAMKLSFLLIGAREADGDRLRLTTAHPEQVIQTQAFSFPREVRGGAVETTGDSRIEAGWIDGGVARAAKGSKADKGRLPVGVVTVFVEGGRIRTDRSLYLVGYSLHPRMLRADKVELEGLSLLRRGIGEDVQTVVDAEWARRRPRPEPEPEPESEAPEPTP